MVLMKCSGSCSHRTMSSKRLAESPVRSSLRWMKSLFSAQEPVVKAKRKGIIDWHFKPEVISVDGVDVHYTSLRDIMPAMLLQCKQDPVSGEGICGSPRTRMKNHLVEQAARAYLQPSTVEYNNSNQFFPWNWQKLMGYTPLTFSMNIPKPPLESCMAFFSSLTKLSLSRALRYLLGRVRPQPVGFLQPRLC